MWNQMENGITKKQYIVCNIIIDNLKFKAYTRTNKLIIITNTLKYIITTKTEARNFISKYIEKSKAKRVENIRISNFEEYIETEGLIEEY